VVDAARAALAIGPERNIGEGSHAIDYI